MAFVIENCIEKQGMTDQGGWNDVFWQLVDNRIHYIQIKNFAGSFRMGWSKTWPDIMVLGAAL
jgi:hypothetical protein